MRKQQAKWMSLTGFDLMLNRERRGTNMKYIVILGDGMADEPIAEIDARRPLLGALPWRH